ncbi:ATP-dependent 6-phosphofructokinase 6-like protein [Tanacetum coccineum]
MITNAVELLLVLLEVAMTSQRSLTAFKTVVYIIGGDGTQKGAAVIFEEIKRRGIKAVVAGIPKTIDNDIAVIDKSFGFDTAVEEAQRAINAAHVEAESAENGIGVVKLMGRYSGFIAMYATLASRDVDLCLIPESPFFLEGEGGLFEYVEKRVKENGHMVIVVAEGAGQELVAQSNSATTQDASGNKLLKDVGMWLSDSIKELILLMVSISCSDLDRLERSGVASCSYGAPPDCVAISMSKCLSGLHLLMYSASYVWLADIVAWKFFKANWDVS